MIHLVLGGARSGKSSFAENWLINLANKHEKTPHYIATAQALDSEMAQRIAHHQKDRADSEWLLTECPLDLSKKINDLPSSSIVLVDCLTLWLTNHLMKAQQKYQTSQQISAYLSTQIEQLTNTLAQSSITIALVSNEVGLGVIPMGKETRLFVDHAGRLNQQIATVAQQVTLVTAGLPLTLKQQES